MTPVVLVTGGAHGIGAAIARRFVVAGSHAVIADIDHAAAEAEADRIRTAGGGATAVQLDVASESSWAEAADTLEQAGLLPRFIVNNAFANTVAPAHVLAATDWDRTIAVTLKGVYLSVKTFHESLVANRGAVVNVSSVHAVLGWPGHPAYAAAKGGVVSLTRQLSLEYAPEVRVNAVLPGSIQTRVWEALDDGARSAAAQQATLRRFGTPEEVAEAVEFLASERASYITGVALLVDGGMSTTVVR